MGFQSRMKYCVLLMLLFISFSQSCFAVGTDEDVCTSNPVSVVLSGDVHFQRDDPVGQESDFINPIIGTTLTCNGPLDIAAEDRDLWFKFLVVPTQSVSGFDGVFATNLAGVGVKYYFTVSDFSGFSLCGAESSQDYFRNNNSYYGVKCHWMHGTQNSSVTVQIKAKLVKTSQPLNSGALLTIPSVINTKVEYNYTGYTKKTSDINLTSSVKVFSDKCTLMNDKLLFDMGNVSVDKFSSQIGFSPDNSATQNMVLSCDANANINIMLAGVKNPDSSKDSVLSLSNQGQPGVADGVGIEILYDGQPLELNKLLNLMRSNGGQEIIPITAHYYQTKSQVKPGTANGIATLNLTYQ